MSLFNSKEKKQAQIKPVGQAQVKPVEINPDAVTPEQMFIMIFQLLQCLEDRVSIIENGLFRIAESFIPAISIGKLKWKCESDGVENQIRDLKSQFPFAWDQSGQKIIQEVKK